MAQHNTPTPTKQPAVVLEKKHGDGEHVTVSFWNLRVLIVPDGNHFFAQCYEIDYAAQGDSVEDAKRNFEKGLEATVHHHLNMFGSIQKMMEPVSPEFWNDLLLGAKGMNFTYGTRALHQILPKKAELLAPYQNVAYAQAMRVAA